MFKFRKLGIVILITMIASFLLSMVALWNFLLANDAQHAGWIVFSIIALFGNGLIMFLFLYKMTDHELLDGYVQSILENEQALNDSSDGEDRKEILDVEESMAEEEIEASAKQILAGLDAKATKDLCDQLLRSLSKHLEFVQGVMYIREKKSRQFKPATNFALTGKDPGPFESGECFAGQAVESKSIIRINDIPEKYFDVSSGLGNAKPKHLLFVPILYKNQSIALIEVGSFRKPGEKTEKILQKVSEETGKILHNFISS